MIAAGAVGASLSPGIAVRGDLAFGGAFLFRDLDLHVAGGCWTCLLGRSGVGKSSLLRLIAGLDTGGVFTGQVRADDGRPLVGRIAYMAQSDLLLPWLNVIDNVLIGARLRAGRLDGDHAMAIVERVGLIGHEGKFPRQLSGGMRQRAALARTLMEDRPVALLDEPFSALDAATRAEMQELAFEMLGNRTVLLVTHDPAEAARLGNVIHILDEKGLERLRVSGPPPIRAIDAPETFALQSRLLARLRGSAA